MRLGGFSYKAWPTGHITTRKAAGLPSRDVLSNTTSPISPQGPLGFQKVPVQLHKLIEQVAHCVKSLYSGFDG